MRFRNVFQMSRSHLLQAMLYLLKILPHRSPQIGIAQHRSRMIRRHKLGPPALKPLPMCLSHLNPLTQDAMGSRQTKEHYKPGPDNCILLPKPGKTSLHLRHHRGSIARWTAFDNVCYVHALAGHPSRLQYLVEQLPRLPYKWSSQLVLSLTWAFPDKHNRRIRVPFSEYYTPAAVTQSTVMAISGFLSQVC